MHPHFKRTRDSLVVQIGGVIIFAALFGLIARVWQPAPSGGALLLVGILMALVPAVLWLVSFYRADRQETEPLPFVLGIFLLGALVAQAIGQPLIRSVFRVQDAGSAGLLTQLLDAILIVGLVQEFLKYAAVRYTVFNSATFNQRVHGIIYGASAGLGYATTLNIQYIVGNNGVHLGIGAVRVAIAALAHGSFGGLTGYFLGRAKFDNMGPFWLPIGLLAAAILNGTVSVMLREVSNLGGLHFNPWYGLVGAAIVAGVLFSILLGVIHRLNVAAMAAGPPAFIG